MPRRTKQRMKYGIARFNRPVGNTDGLSLTKQEMRYASSVSYYKRLQELNRIYGVSRWEHLKLISNHTTPLVRRNVQAGAHPLRTIWYTHIDRRK